MNHGVLQVHGEVTLKIVGPWVQLAQKQTRLANNTLASRVRYK